MDWIYNIIDIEIPGGKVFIGFNDITVIAIVSWILSNIFCSKKNE